MSSALRIGHHSNPRKTIADQKGQSTSSRTLPRSWCAFPLQKGFAFQGLVLRRLSWKGLECRCRAPEAMGPADDLRSQIRRKRLAVFVSGTGSNFRSIHEASIGGLVCGDVVALVTDKPGGGGAEYARASGIPVILSPKSKTLPEGLSSVELVTALKYSGPTVHFVDEHYDTGRTLAQRVVPVLADDSPERLAARVLHEEHQIYVEAVAASCDERILWREDGVPLIRSRTNLDNYY